MRHSMGYSGLYTVCVLVYVCVILHVVINIESCAVYYWVYDTGKYMATWNCLCYLDTMVQLSSC